MFEIPHNVGLNPFQPGPRRLHAVRRDAEGYQLRADNAVVAFGNLVFQHFHILGPDTVKLVMPRGDIHGVLAFRPGVVVDEGKLEGQGAVKVVQEGAPPVKDSRLIFGLRELVVDVLKLHRLCVNAVV